ncbi:MAG TPA: cytochrome P460 family protein [Variovorax sp.]|nr:cytochrome P460 family protein [Variovorax sp.]
MSNVDAATRSAASFSPRATRAKIAGISLLALMAAAGVFAVVSQAAADTKEAEASPLYGVTVPKGYKQWQLIAPAIEAEPLNELRVVLGNAIAIEAYDKGTLPFPDGTVLTKLAWKRVQSPEFPPATIPGEATTVQVMVKDSKKYAATGGWGFGRFINGKPVDLAQHQTCFACHQALVKNHDYVFTRLAH